MEKGIALLSIIPIRKEPAHTSEMVSQLVFGEVYIIQKSSGNWMEICCAYDNYCGWINSCQHNHLNEKDFQSYKSEGHGVALDMVSSASSGKQAIPIVAGSTLPFFDGMNLKAGKEKFIYNGQAVPDNGKTPGIFERVALRYLNAPYLWGGRSPFGIDCSGFTQMVFKYCGISLPRDAYQQAEEGNVVNFIEEALPGDLAFFNNDEGRITHVGIVLKEQRIIHSSGKVRLDKLDHFGVYNHDIKKYSHQLKIIKRIF